MGKKLLKLLLLAVALAAVGFGSYKGVIAIWGEEEQPTLTSMPEGTGSEEKKGTTIKDVLVTAYYYDNYMKGTIDYCAVRFFNVNTKESNYIFFPSDSEVTMSDEAYQALYAASTNVKQKTKLSAVGKCFGQDSDRYSNTKRVLEDIVGTDIDYYETITSDDVIRIVNLQDPVNFDVPKKMTFKDDSNIKVVLNKGAQSLLGDQVKGMLTKVDLYSSELARMQCSMDYCKAYLSALTTLDRDSLGTYYEKYYTYVESNTSYEGMRPYMDYLYQVKPSNIVMTAAAGKETDSAYVLDTDAIQEMVKGFLVTTTADTGAEPDSSEAAASEDTAEPATTEETTEEVTTEEVTEEVTTEEETEAEPEDSKDLRIEIYNSTTINGLAGRWQERLKKDGYNVINTDTERSYHLKECVIYVTEKGQGEDLLEYFPNAEIKVGTLTKADIRIVLGTNNKEVKK